MKEYINLTLGSKDFTFPKTCIVAIEENFELISDYVPLAKAKACKAMGCTEDNVTVLNWRFLGSQVYFFG